MKICGMKIIEHYAFTFLTIISKLIGLLPKPVLVIPLSLLFRLGFKFNRRMRETALRNLEIAFPDQSREWKQALLKQNAREMALFVVDALTLPTLSRKWIQEHTILKNHAEFAATAAERGVLLVGAHFGSFELLPSIIKILGADITIVVRPFKSGFCNALWTKMREARGVTTIDRKNGIRKLRSLLKANECVGILFDQNVTKNHATFPTWFSLPAATSKAPALLALGTKCPVWMATIHREAHKYVVTFTEIKLEDLRENPDLNKNQKIDLMTQRLVDQIVAEIRRYPQGWFWIHRRWKTRPEGEPETIYKHY